MLFLLSSSLKGWRSCTFSLVPDFLAKTQNPSVHDFYFEEFTVPSLVDFVYRDRDEMLLCSIRAIRYFSRAEQSWPECVSQSVLTTKRKKGVCRNTILLGIRLVISHAYLSVTNKDCRAVKVKTHKVWKIRSFTYL